jgi:hypothetical protein
VTVPTENDAKAKKARKIKQAKIANDKNLKL